MKKKIIKSVFIIMGIIILIYLFKNQFNDFIKSFSKSFYRTVLEEQRYKLLLNGFSYTIIISFISIFCGTIIGLIIFKMRKFKYKFIAKVVRFFVKFIQGIPITILLLAFYYVIFGKINIDPLIVAIITFSIYFSAYVSEIFRGAFESINNSQILSAYSLGFTKYQTYRYIIFPQALAYTIPVFKNEAVSLIKLTSIAGYISIMDITKASDIIRNRTYEAFFPLIIAAVIYFITCFIISISLDCLYKKVCRRKYLKGKKLC